MRVAAFFDLDGTLLSVNSGKLWIKQEWRKGRLTTRQLGLAAFYMVGYRLGAIDMDQAMRKALQTVVGLSEEMVRRRTEEWYEREVRHRAARGGWAVIERHRREGHLLVLHTSSSPYEAAIAKEQFGLEHALSTRYEVRDGKFTGEVLAPICFGAGKVTVAENFAAEHDVDLDASYFYTDSITDLPMLERVGNPRIVAPDLRLKREASRRGWQVLDWSR